MKLWTVQDARDNLGVNESYIRRVLREQGIPGVEKVGRIWLGSPAKWRAWNEKRDKRTRRMTM